MSYVIKPRVVVDTYYKVEYYETPSNISDPTVVFMDINRHGIRIVVRQTGRRACVYPGEVLQPCCKA